MVGLEVNFHIMQLTFVSDAVPYSSVPQMYKILYCRNRQNLRQEVNVNEVS